jgi:8-oxo-dGTP diphosphatase
MNKVPDCFYRVSVKALIKNKENKFLLFKQDNEYWDLPGGGLEFGEATHEGLKREVFEEAGLKITSVQEQPTYFYPLLDDENKWVTNAVYEAEVENLEITPSHECIEAKYVDKYEAESFKLPNNVKCFLELIPE